MALDGENAVVRRGQRELGRVPLHTLDGIMCFSYPGASPKLMGACAERGIALSFFDPRGHFLARSVGAQQGNVLLRKKQYSWSESCEKSLLLSKNFIIGKVYNGRWVLERALRDHGLRIDASAVGRASENLKSSLVRIKNCNSVESVRGIEGEAAAAYFGVFGQLVLRNSETFAFQGRVRRPPTDPVNAMLSLFYTVLASDCAAALEGVGLDPYVGFLHCDRPGRKSLALDLMEELRPVIVDRFVLTSINNRIVGPGHFERRETGEVLLTDKGRKTLFEAWQNRKREEILHPFLKEKISRGLLPHVQALLLSRCLRGDLDAYPPFLWK
ncbi:type I-C CRISPR-associated endonuclease Cas1c [Xiamenia xianingshaonis]|uniref:type I-C CRISPR-associated endonuclease Cas1c n=1 Tax=Xiamenia xianingshaonis TaxID=2682776 RepID=UPI0036F27058